MVGEVGEVLNDGWKERKWKIKRKNQVNELLNAIVRLNISIHIREENDTQKV